MAKKVQDGTHKQNPMLLVSYETAKKMIGDRILLGIALKERKPQSSQELEEKKADWNKWDEYNDTMLKRIFNNDTIAREYSIVGAAMYILNMYSEVSILQKNQEINDKIQRKIDKLSSIIERLELYEVVESDIQQIELKKQPMYNEKIFIVHGRDDKHKLEVARTLEKLDLEAVILHEQPNAGQTIIEKLEANSNVGFAVVLLTPDDKGNEKSQSELKPRARQNVIAELGYFIGKLGRNRVCALYVEGVEIPSDFNGVAYVLFDSAGNWKFELVRELKAAGYKVDANKLI